MLPDTHREDPQESAKRYANLITLRFLEKKLPTSLFDQVVATVQDQMDLPLRIDWKGQKRKLQFEEAKLNFSQFDHNYLPQLLQNQTDGAGHQSFKKDLTINTINPKIQNFLRSKLVTGEHSNLLLKVKGLHFQNLATDQKKNLKNYQISRYQRVKTIFGHALINEGYNAPIYNVIYDQTGSFIISAADDGIIKIWDKETMNLQGSLHSHQEVIQDMDISNCNRYLASASKDGKLIVWDWKNCQKLDEIAAHNMIINNIKFFSLKVKPISSGGSQSAQAGKEPEKIQILATCSDDGTVKIYDEITYINQINEQKAKANDEAPSTRRARGRPEGSNQTQKKERYFQVLTPNDFRPVAGSKNKKIDSININQQGLVAAGTNSGEIYLWKLDVQKFKQQHPKAFVWLGTSKKHQKSVHICVFSPNGKHLLTGSIDGTAKVWNVENEKVKSKNNENFIALTDQRLVTTLEETRMYKKKDHEILLVNRNGDQMSLAEYRQSKSKWQCDSATWSCNGRYAICGISGNFTPEDNNDVSIIKIWDSFTNTIIQDIAQENGITLKSFTFALSTHPQMEEIFFSGSDGGLVCLWNIKERKLIKQFLEYGVYSFEKYTMNDPYDGKFSPDGSSFVVGSVMGTISLFACDQSQFKYEGTRVEQFYINDEIMHNTNIYYDRDEEPQICPYSQIPYEIQPPSSFLGKFKNFRQLTHEEYERNLIIRQEMAREEENFISSQLEEGMRNDLFRDNLGDLLEFQDELILDNNVRQVLVQNRGRVNSQISQISNNNQNQIGSQEEIDIVRNLNQRRGRGGNNVIGRGQRRLQGGRRQLEEAKEVQINPNFDPENSIYDRKSDENFEMEEANEEDDSEEEEDFSEDGSEVYRDRGAVSRYQRENYHQRGDQRDNSRQNPRNGGILTRNQLQTQAVRSLRNQRRNNARKNFEDSEEEEIKRPQDQSRRSKRRTVTVKSGDPTQNDVSEDDDFNMSRDDDSEEVITRPRRTLRRGGNRKQKIGQDDFDNEEMNSDEDSDMQSEDNQENDYSGIRTRRAKNNQANNRKASQPKSGQISNNQRGGRSLRRRNNRRNYNENESYSDDDFMDYDDTKKGSQENKNEAQGKRSAGRVLQEESESDEVDQDVTVPDFNRKMKGDEDYELMEGQNNQNNNKERKCEFCKRSDLPIIGPFMKVIRQSRGPDGPLYFHKDCIEVNTYSFFNPQKQKWMNIGKALEMMSKSNLMCRRCHGIGATIKCTSCSKAYHGYLCSTLYMIEAGDRIFQCFDCRNKDNYKFAKGKELLEKQDIKLTKRALQRDFFLQTTQKKEKYLPQINDLVYYFFQGHEKFISQYNCFFYAGEDQKLQFQYPWKVYRELEAPCLCRILKIRFTFPSMNILYLCKRFGKSSNINQIPQIIMNIELCINDDPDKTFELDFFPNELPDFIVLKKLYENSLFMKNELSEQGSFIGAAFSLRSNNQLKVKVIGEVEREKEIIQEPTGWESIQFRIIEDPNIRDRGRRSQRRNGVADQNEEQNNESPDQMNFWQLVLNQEHEKNLETLGLSSAFDQEEIQRILDVIDEYISKNKDQTVPFMSRVAEKIAPDYRQHIAAEMYMELIQERLLNKYYRSQEQLFSDLDLISYNARLYNGEDHPLFKDSKKMVEKLRIEIKKILNFSDDAKRQKFEETKGLLQYQKPSGKMTAPALGQKNSKILSMNQFRDNLQNNHNSNQMEEIKQQNHQVFQIQQQPQAFEKIQPSVFSYVHQPQAQNQLPDSQVKVESNNLIIQIHLNQIQPSVQMNQYQMSDYQMNQFSNQNQMYPVNQISQQNNKSNSYYNDNNDSEDLKITPYSKIQIQNQSMNSMRQNNNNMQDSSSTSINQPTRRSLRNQASNSNNTSTQQFDTDAFQKQYGTGEKVSASRSQVDGGQIPAQSASSVGEQHSMNIDGNLGKRTRSGRQTRQIRKDLNEDEDDKQFENMLGGGNTNNGKNEGSKRIRQN